MSEQLLDDSGANAFFEQVGSEAVAQAVWVDVVESNSFGCLVGNGLDAFSRALAISSLQYVAFLADVFDQSLGFFWKGDEAVFVAFALFDKNVGWTDVFDFEISKLVESQSRTVEEDECEFVLWIYCVSDHGLYFLFA